MGSVLRYYLLPPLADALKGRMLILELLIP